jgi:hypothetical protein
MHADATTQLTIAISGRDNHILTLADLHPFHFIFQTDNDISVTSQKLQGPLVFGRIDLLPVNFQRIFHRNYNTILH